MVMVEADEYKIFQVIYNLVNNAINYTGDDKQIWVRQIVREDGYVRIEVTDSGEESLRRRFRMCGTATIKWTRHTSGRSWEPDSDFRS